MPLATTPKERFGLEAYGSASGGVGRKGEVQGLLRNSHTLRRHVRHWWERVAPPRTTSLPDNPPAGVMLHARRLVVGVSAHHNGRWVALHPLSSGWR